MFANYLFIAVLGLYLLLGLALLVFKRKRSGILIAFSLICWLALLPIGILSQFSLFSDPVEVEIINYSPRKGHLYFFRSADCSSRILYDFAVNANEESSLEVDGEKGAFAKVIFSTENGQLLEFPLGEDTYGKLAIWEKELQPADSCYSAPIQDYRQRQLRYTIAIGLLILGATFMFGARSGDKKKWNQQRKIAQRKFY